MRYIKNTLLEGEDIIYATRPHWIIFLSAGLALLGSLLVVVFGSAFLNFSLGFIQLPFYALIAWALFFVALYYAVVAFVRYSTSEYGVTNKRVIMKVGWIARDAFDTFVARIEGIKVWQSVLGRILGYGTITVIGTGGTSDSFLNVRDPLQFRRMVQEQIDQSLQDSSSDKSEQ